MELRIAAASAHVTYSLCQRERRTSRIEGKADRRTGRRRRPASFSPGGRRAVRDLETLHVALDRLPPIVSAGHVAGVEPGLAQGDRGLSAHVEAVDAEGDDRGALGQLAHPLLDAIGIAPDRAGQDVVRLGDGVARPRVDDLDR